MLIRVVAIFSLPLLAACAVEPSNFELYKNSIYSSCPHLNETTSAPQTVVNGGMSYSFSVNFSPSEFCTYFWDYTVVPTIPRDSAFSFTWVSCVVNYVAAIAMGLLGVALSREPVREVKQEKDAVSTKPEEGWSLLEEELPHSPRKPRKQGVIQTTRKCFRTIWAAANRPQFYSLSPLFWFFFLYQSIAIAIWFHNFILLARHRSTATNVAIMSFLMPYQFCIALQSTIMHSRRWTYWVPAGFTFVQYFLTIAALVLMTNTGGMHYDLVPGFILPDECDAERLLTDPLAQSVLWFITGVFIFLSIIFAMYSVSHIVAEIGGEVSGRKRTRSLLASVVAISVYGVLWIGLFCMYVSKRRAPVVWDDQCKMVHVMMNPKDGYWDVDTGRGWRIFRAWFGNL